MREVMDWKFFVKIAIAVVAISVFLSAALADGLTIVGEALADQEVEKTVNADAKTLIHLSLAKKAVEKMDANAIQQLQELPFVTVAYKIQNDSYSEAVGSPRLV